MQQSPVVVDGSSARGGTGVVQPDRYGPLERGPDEYVNKSASTAFFVVHLLPLLVIVTGITRTAVVLFFATYFIRMFAITAGYHRYFAHRAFKLNRFWQFVLAFLGTTAAQKGPLWWAAHHRNHHRYSDTEADVHSPRRGFWWSHVGWILCDRYKPTETDQIRDFAKYPELRFLNNHSGIGPWSMGIACFLIGGWSGLIVGFFASTVVLWHATFMVNSAAHVFGRRTYDTDDTSRNNLWIALVTGGEGWHNNHHRYPFTVRQGFRWWQIDATFYLLVGLRSLGIVKAMRPVPVAVIDEGRAARARRRAPGTSRS